MSAPRPQLNKAPAWICLLACASLATLAAAASLLVLSEPGVARAGMGSFGLGGLAEASPVPAPAPEAAAPTPPAAAEAPPPRKKSLPGSAEKPVAVPVRAETTAKEVAQAPAHQVAPPPAPAVVQPGSQPARAVAPDPNLQGSGATQAQAPAPQAASEVRYGTHVSGQMILAGLVVPLPPGEWRVVADIPATNRRDVALMREAGSVISGAVVASYMWGAGGLGYPRGSTCTRSGVRGLIDKNDDFGDQACWLTSVLPAKSVLEFAPQTPVGKALRGEIDTKVLKINSEVVVSSVLMLGNMQRKVVVLTFDNPEAAGIEPKPFTSAENSDWHTKNLAQHPEKVKYVREQLQWASQAYQQLKGSFAAAN